MGTFGRLILQTVILAVIGIVIALICPSEAKLWVLLTSALLCIVFIVISLIRRRQIMNLVNEIDEVLHTGRKITFTSCSEGDIAVLSNELAKMVARLARTQDQLAQERNALADSLADVSHQIRTPLTAAGLMLPIIEKAENTHERIRAVRELEALLERISWLITTLLKMAKIDAGAITFEAVETPVRDIVEQAAAPMAPLLDLHGIELVCDLSNTASFTGDARWTTEALANIIKNCAEHTPHGSAITITSTSDPISTSITVQDEGPGISDEDLPHLFERFYRGAREQDAGSFPTGFGIGLSLAQALISAQNGTLRAKNAPAGGALFEITFPKLNL